MSHYCSLEIHWPANEADLVAAPHTAENGLKEIKLKIVAKVVWQGTKKFRIIIAKPDWGWLSSPGKSLIEIPQPVPGNVDSGNRRFSPTLTVTATSSCRLYIWRQHARATHLRVPVNAYASDFMQAYSLFRRAMHPSTRIGRYVSATCISTRGR